jgi:leucyl-tRNA synthetase
VVLQINGKIIDRLDVSPSISKENLEIAARANEKVAAALAGVEVKKAIVVPPKLVNFVI